MWLNPLTAPTRSGSTRSWMMTQGADAERYMNNTDSDINSTAPVRLSTMPPKPMHSDDRARNPPSINLRETKRSMCCAA